MDIFISKKLVSESAFVDIDRNQYEQFILNKMMWNTLYINVSSIYIYVYIYFACLVVCLFVSNKRKNGGTARVQNF